MAAAIQAELGLESELIKGDGGVFDVDFGPTRVYSKRETGRFPDNGEVIESLRGMRPERATD